MDRIIRSISLEYILTRDELDKNAVANLGDMDEFSYKEFIAKMEEIAKTAGIKRPKLAIWTKDVDSYEQVFSLEERNWELVKSEAKTLCSAKPRVFVIDGGQYVVYSYGS